MLFKNKFIFLTVLLITAGFMSFSYGMHGWFNKGKKNFFRAKQNINNQLTKKVVYYRHHDSAREKFQENFASALLFSTGIYAFIDIYNNHLDDITTTTISDLLETEAGKKIIDESVQKIVNPMKKSMIRSIEKVDITDITTNLLKSILKKGLKDGFITSNKATGMSKLNIALSLMPNKKIDNAIDTVLTIDALEKNIELSSDLTKNLTKNQLEKLINSEEFHDILTQSTKTLIDYALSPETSKLSPEIKNILEETFKEEINTLQQLAGLYTYVGAVKVMPIVTLPYTSVLQNFNLSTAIAISAAYTFIPLNMMCKVLDKESVMKVVRATVNFDDNFKDTLPNLHQYKDFFLNRYEQLTLEENYLTQEESIISALKTGTIDTFQEIGENVQKKITNDTKALNLIVRLNDVTPINNNIKTLK